MNEELPGSLREEIVLSPRLVDGWQREVDEIDQEIRKLEAKRTSTVRLITKARELFDLLNADDQRPFDTVGGAASMAEAVRRAADELGRTTHHDLRERIGRSRWGDALRESDKAFYHALGRLFASGKLIKHRGWIFTKRAHEQHLIDVQAGSKEDTAAPMRRGLGLGDAAEYFIRENSGCAPKDVVEYLSGLDGIGKGVQRNPNGGYNVISRLARKGVIVKVDGLLFTPENVEAAGPDLLDEPAAPSVHSNQEGGEGNAPATT